MSNSFICGGKCHRPWHYGGEHSLLNVAICLLAYCWCKIQCTVVLDLRIVNMNERSRCVAGCITHYDGVPTWNDPSPQHRLTSWTSQDIPLELAWLYGSVCAGCRVKGWQLKTRCPLSNLCEVMVSKAKVKVTSFEKLKLWAVEKLKNQSSKSMRTHGSKFAVKTRPQHCQKLVNILGKLGFSFS